MYKDILDHVWAPDETSKNFKELRVDPLDDPARNHRHHSPEESRDQA